MWKSSSVKYSPVPTADSTVAIDFRSPFRYDSAFKYSGGTKGSRPAYLSEHREYNPPFIVHLCTSLVIFLSFLAMILTFPLSGFFCIKVIQQYERIVVFRLGRLQPLKGPGVVLILPCIDRCRRVDMRMKAFNVPPQKILTVDNALISCGANVHFQINDVIGSVTAVQDLNHATRAIGQTALNNLLLTKELHKIKTEKVYLNDILQKELNTSTQEWGVTITRVEISEITVIKEPDPFSAGQAVMSSIQSMFQSPGMSSAQSPPMMSPMATTQTYPMPAIPEKMAEPIKSPVPTMSAGDILSAVKLLLNESLVESIGAVFKFVINGGTTEIYYLDLKNGSGDAGTGDPPGGEPDVVLEMSTGDMQKLFSGELKPFQAYMSGQLVVTGDRGVAMKLEHVIKRLQGSDR